MKLHGTGSDSVMITTPTKIYMIYFGDFSGPEMDYLNYFVSHISHSDWFALQCGLTFAQPFVSTGGIR